MNKYEHLSKLTPHLRQVESVTDRLGKPIDNNIKLLIAVLWAHGFITDNSCGGHIEYRNGGPFIWFSSQTAKQKMHRMKQTKPLGGEEYTAIYEQIRPASLKEQKRFIDLLEKFYAEHHQSSTLLRIVVESRAVGSGVLLFQGAAVVDEFYDNQSREEWLLAVRKELDVFTNFLIDELHKKAKRQFRI